MFKGKLKASDLMGKRRLLRRNADLRQGWTRVCWIWTIHNGRDPSNRSITIIFVHLSYYGHP
jgi:hypothetical protein